MKKIICLDPGHGGDDTGAIGYSGSLEKNLNLQLALSLYELLKDEFYPFLTRYDDRYLKLYDRAKLANLIGADLFISLHFNAVDSKEVEGLEVLYYPAEESRSLAERINQQLQPLGRVDRGIKAREDLVVLNSTKMTSCLVEGGFITNPQEEKLILTKEYQQELAQAIYQGISKYLGWNML